MLWLSAVVNPLTVAYFWRTSLSYVLLDAESAPGGAWRHGWDSLRLFSPSAWSSIAGWPVPAYRKAHYRDDVIDYLTLYERRYDFPMRSTRVTRVEKIEGLRVVSGDRNWDAKRLSVQQAPGAARPPRACIPGTEVVRGAAASFRSLRWAG